MDVVILALLLLALPFYTYVLSKVVSAGCVAGMLIAFQNHHQAQERKNANRKKAQEQLSG
jgi:hypothetical protein